MSSLNEILQNSRQALQIQQLAMQVIGQNTSNVNTEGYSRRRVELTYAAPHEFIGAWNGGGGVDIQFLGRVRDQVVERQILQGTSEESYWGTKSEQLGRVEEIFDELSGVAISDKLQEFWSAWQELANDPEGTSTRISLRQKAETLAAAVRRADGQLRERNDSLNEQVLDNVDGINQLTSAIAELNVAIVNAESHGTEASDLRDTRDQRIEELSRLIPVHVVADVTGVINVYSDGQILVQTDHSIELTTTQQSVDGRNTVVIQVGHHGSFFNPESGQLRALQSLRDTEIATAARGLDEFARTLAQQVNEVHQTGFGLNGSHGIEFFAADVVDAATFRISAFIEQDVNSIATAGADGAPGDNSIALAIAGIQTEKSMNGGRHTLGEFYAEIPLVLGSNREHAAAQLEVQTGAMENLRARRAGISGVSMDEEMARLIQVQTAYEAAAKLITTVDEMMQTVLNI